MENIHKEITFDGFVRGLIAVVGCIAAFFVLRSLSNVLLPFFVAWLLAYLIYPLVTFFQYKCRLRFRVPCIVLALMLSLALVCGIFALVIPPTISEFAKLRGDIVQLIQSFGESPLAAEIDHYLSLNFDDKALSKVFSNKDMMAVIQAGASQLWSLVTNVFSLLRSIVGSVLVLLYLFFILMDYEQLSSGFVNLVPRKRRYAASRILQDVQSNMHAYFRGQSLIALLVGIMFAIGFSIIGLPMAVGLGLFIGLLNLVPYLQVAGIVPAVLLALVRSNQTGENFWLILLYCFILFLIVQGIQDLVLTPRIMGKMMGLRPAVILLSLSIWGSLLGFIGLIIALPLTTLLISYYKLFVLKEQKPE